MFGFSVEKNVRECLECFLIGLKVSETNERELVLEPAVKWAGNPNIIVAVTISSVKVTVQVKSRAYVHDRVHVTKHVFHTLNFFYS